MHFVTGGAFTGKRRWVTEYYQLDQSNDYKWFSAYQHDDLPGHWKSINESIVVVEGMETWIKHECKFGDWSDRSWMQWLEAMLVWENEKSRTCIIIGTDISKGIVPSMKWERDWRDQTGRWYQSITSNADQVDVIWNGLNLTLKEKGVKTHENLYT
ncbi:bifunctional adenosylcobinamide kinase/adenosylcobinamide-phosphate guanylyltransferase [Pseudalkalibacillus sp. SCS-8]|uniref:bifunctional adenosylcobinamide kinase/adenosylcobinamide-phosphate guanylyltransferase n=1 Tax=Pseudalkalibacillus nanhaiensis TaxID=3115291 RepID=UPI0032DB67DA